MRTDVYKAIDGGPVAQTEGRAAAHKAIDSERDYQDLRWVIRPHQIGPAPASAREVLPLDSGRLMGVRHGSRRILLAHGFRSKRIEAR
jgi:hypothetical protein